MNTKIGRFYTFIKKEKTCNFFSFVFYILFIVMLIEINLPLALEIICSIVQMFIILYGYIVYLIDQTNKRFERNEEKLGKSIIQKIKKFSKEIAMFIPVFLISYCIDNFIMIEKPANQTSIEELFYEAPILNSISIIIIGPIIEEIIFRLLPYRFIKNKTLYIIVSAVIFAAMHVINDTNPFYYIWFYMVNSLYYGYRYYKTKDIWVTISIHSFNNLIATLIFIFS